MPFKSLAAALVLAAGLVMFPAADKASARRHVQAAAGAVTPCDAVAVVNDPDPQGMNVRSGPGSTFKVIGNLPNADVNGISVHITGAQGEWVRIDRADEQGGEPEDRVFFKGSGVGLCAAAHGGRRGRDRGRDEALQGAFGEEPRRRAHAGGRGRRHGARLQGQVALRRAQEGARVGRARHHLLERADELQLALM